MNNINDFKTRFDQLQKADEGGVIAGIRKSGFETFNKLGIPGIREEEWKYTNLTGLFDKTYGIATDARVSSSDIDLVRLPGGPEANELVFVNGRYDAGLSNIRSAEGLLVLPLEEALSGAHKELVKAHLNQSSIYIKDGVQALNTSLIQGGIFVHISNELLHPVYMYHLADTRTGNMLSQPRSLIYIAENSKLELVEHHTTLGSGEGFTNEVMEIVVQQNAFVEYYKIQNDNINASQVSTTHITQAGKSYIHAVTVTLNGGIVRNNLNLILDAPGNETHLYGLYLLKGHTHADNHTLIDNKFPNSFSNQLYKGIADDESTAVFNGRIVVQPDAQKTNAYQSNKNILLSDNATINTKPQLEIFADDVKCSHGCTVGQLDEDALFYLRARGIPKESAEVLLLQAFAADILNQIKPEPLRLHVEQLIYKHLSI